MKAVAARLRQGSPTAKDGVYPFYRMLLPSQHHFYTASAAEMEAAAKEGYTKEGDIGGVLARPEAGAVPLYHLFGRNDHFYTISHSEAVNAVNQYGYGYCDIAGFVYEEGAPDGKPVYRHFNSTHFYTSSVEESEKIPQSGWKLEGIAFLTVKPD